MADFDSQTHTTVGEKTIISVDTEKAMRIAVDAPSGVKYEIQFRLDSSGLRHPILSEDGNTNLTLLGVDGVGINITAIPSGTLTFEVLSNLDIIV